MLELNPSQKDTERKTLFAHVLLPVPVPKAFTYRVPLELNDYIAAGQRVIVQFGRTKILTGVVRSLSQEAPQEHEAKYLLDILDEDPLLGQVHLDFLHWISEYYMCTEGEVLNVMLPAGLKLSSESRVQLNPEFDLLDSSYPFTDHETNIIEALENTENLTYAQISDITGLKSIYSILKSLVAKEAILIYEEVQDRYKPKVEKRIRLNPSLLENEGDLEEVFDKLERYPKQLEVLMGYLQEVPAFNDKKKNGEGVAKSFFSNAQLSMSSLKTLLAKETLVEFERIVSRFPDAVPTESTINLTPTQQNAMDGIGDGFSRQKPVLLHGITGSGKTEIYIRLIQETIDNGHQVLYLLPEIALTTQIVTRLRKVFGNRMGVYHSKFSDNERVEVWTGMHQHRFDVIVGVRSSIFLPFQNLGLIIIDEEHENSYKQMDPAPRYHARDAALMLGKMHHANVLLGSATPSFESYHQVNLDNYHIVTLNERFGKAHLPDIVFADMSKERKKKTTHGEFSKTLHDAIEKTLEANEQAIIFQNRRGYAPYLTCGTCGWIPQCQNCSVSLTYHLMQNELRCHYCGYKQALPQWCDSCSSTDLSTKRFGTEKLEEELKLLFPEANIRRMDLDTTRRKLSYQNIIEDFESGKIDILVGTQMVSKGLDFHRVGLVGVFDVDRMLHFPDFRAHERTFQLITQVSGRAGRRDKKGLVVIQTYSPEQPTLQLIQSYDYSRFFDREMRDRERFEYAPFFRLVRIIIRHKEVKTSRNAAQLLSNLLKEKLGQQILGPQEAMIFRVRGLYNYHILIKINRTQGLGKIKDFLLEQANHVHAEKEFRNTKIIFDVDPY